MACLIRFPLALRAARAVLLAVLMLAFVVAPAHGAEEASPTPAPVEPTPTQGGEPAPSPEPILAPAELTPILSPESPTVADVLLFRSRVVVRQYTRYWCIPAAAQTMINLVNGSSVRSYRYQRTLAARVRRHNRYWYRTRGNDVAGWAWALNARIPAAGYAARYYTSRGQAIEAIVEAIDRTGRPVGVVVDRGRHAWVVLGYRATTSGDPAVRSVSGLYVYGPLGTRRDPYPYRYYSLAAFARRFTRYHEWQRRVVWERKFVIVSE